MPILHPSSIQPLTHALNAASCRLVVLIGLVFALGFQAGAAAPPKPGSPFPALKSFSLEGKLPEMQGKVVLVDFWASWCGPCKKAFPVMKELHETFASRGFLVLAISLDEKKSDMEGFLAKTKPPFPTLRDPKGKLAEELAVDAIPTSVLVGSDGKVLAVHSGFEGEASRKAYVQEIETALKTAGR